MSMRELAGKLEQVVTLVPATKTATTNFTGVDAAGALSVTHFALVGQSGDTLSGSVYWTLKLQESDDDSTYTDVADADVIVRNLNTLVTTNSVVIDAAAEDETTIAFGYIGHKRYSRVVATATGTHSNGTPLGGTSVTEARDVPAV